MISQHEIRGISHVLDTAIDESDDRLVELRQKIAEVIGQPNIISVADPNDVTVGGSDSRVDRRGITAVRALEEHHASICEPACDISGCIGGAVVDDDDLADRQGLREEPFKSLSEEAFGLERWNHDRHAQQVQLGETTKWWWPEWVAVV